MAARIDQATARILVQDYMRVQEIRPASFVSDIEKFQGFGYITPKAFGDWVAGKTKMHRENFLRLEEFLRSETFREVVPWVRQTDSQELYERTFGKPDIRLVEAIESLSLTKRNETKQEEPPEKDVNTAQSQSPRYWLGSSEKSDSKFSYSYCVTLNTGTSGYVKLVVFIARTDSFQVVTGVFSTYAPYATGRYWENHNAHTSTRLFLSRTAEELEDDNCDFSLKLYPSTMFSGHECRYAYIPIEKVPVDVIAILDLNLDRVLPHYV